MVVECTILVGSEDYYSCELTRRIPVKVTLVAINGDTGFGIIEPTNGEVKFVQQYIKELRASPSIVKVDVTFRSPEGYWTRVIHKPSGPSIHDTVLQSGCMTCLPIVVESGFQKHLILAPSRETLRDLLHLLRARFSSVKVKKLRSTSIGPSRTLLTEKQREALLLAYNSGYYAIPRKVTLESIAEGLGIKRVAMQERLRRAENRIISDYIEEYR